jgi:hypothetical protein
MKGIKSIEEAEEAGLDISRYLLLDNKYWLFAGDAVALISCINNHAIDVKYLNNPIKQDRLHPMKLHDRCNLYPFDELVKIDVRPAGKPRLSDDQLTDTARRQRKFKEKRRSLQSQKEKEEKEEECLV